MTYNYPFVRLILPEGMTSAEQIFLNRPICIEIIKLALSRVLHLNFLNLFYLLVANEWSRFCLTWPKLLKTLCSQYAFFPKWARWSLNFFAFLTWVGHYLTAKNVLKKSKHGKILGATSLMQNSNFSLTLKKLFFCWHFPDHGHPVSTVYFQLHFLELSLFPLPERESVSLLLSVHASGILVHESLSTHTLAQGTFFAAWNIEASAWSWRSRKG